jgi:hypothetical protein
LDVYVPAHDDGLADAERIDLGQDCFEGGQVAVDVVERRHAGRPGRHCSSVAGGARLTVIRKRATF